MLDHKIDNENHILEFHISGHISREELGKAISALEAPLNDWEEVFVLKKVDSFSGMDIGAWYDDFKFAFENFGKYKKIKKAALVTDKQWMAQLSNITKPLIPGEVKVFSNDQYEEALGWLKA